MNRTGIARVIFAGAAGAATLRVLKRYRVDPAHAPGHQHRGPAPLRSGPTEQTARQPHDQPWIRRSHSDSQQRRFRR